MFPESSGKHHRRSIRLEGYNYALPGAYFVTVCTKNKQCLFGKIANGRMVVNEYGRIVEQEWQKTAVIRPRVIMDEYVMMPNHIHGIIILLENEISSTWQRRGTLQRAPTERFGKPTSDSIPTIVRLIKSSSAVQINELRKMPRVPVWQRGYFEHVIRNETHLTAIRQYIVNNPMQWESDRENPDFGR